MLTKILSYFFLLLLLTKQSHALPDVLKCMHAAKMVERKYGIPKHILSAITITETGKKSFINKQEFHIGWPWTININGKGYYYDNKKSAINAVMSAQKEGKKSIDVGCMQINLKYHKDAFNSLDSAFDPMKNMSYGAEFILSLYKESNSWSKAASYYHSRNPKYNIPYHNKLKNNWLKAEKIMNPNIGKITYLLSLYKPENDNRYMKNKIEIASIRGIIRGEIPF